MKIKIALGLLAVGAAVALIAAPSNAPAQAARTAASKAPAYKAARLAWGAPDLGGTWTNVTITPLQRAAQYGNRTVMTPEEVRAAEGKAIDKAKYEDRPTDPRIGAEDTTNKNCNPASKGGSGAAGRDLARFI